MTRRLVLSRYVLAVLALCVLAAAALSIVAAALLAPSGRPPELTAARHSSLLIVIDGLRADYVTPELMPNLYALGESGVFGERHSSAFPSVTRVNSASISTGSYPARHGLMHNTMFVAEMSDEAFSTGSARNLRRFAKFAGGRLLTAPTLGELLHARGLRLFVTGSGGSGNSLLQNPFAGGDSGMEIWTPGLFVPESAREKALRAVGELPPDDAGRTVWAFDAYLREAASAAPADAVILWIHEVDGAGHRYGVGAPETLDAIAHVDDQIGRLVATLERTGLADRVNIFVTADHGFSTDTGSFNVARTLRGAGLGANDLTVVANMIFMRRDDPAVLARAVEALQRDPAVGNVYTRAARPGSDEGVVPGSLSTSVIQWDHERAADVIVTPTWSDGVNEHGFRGTSSRGGRPGHGSDSPYELRIPLVASGPDIKSGVRSRVPTGNVDFAPTILHLLGVEPPEGMSGRVLEELLRGGPAPGDVTVRERTHEAAVRFEDGFRYRAALDTLEVDGTVYLRGARTIRERPRSPRKTSPARGF
ncbi:MAG TPA: alkaline phosphatase family protein [Gammaproteobacteria bacterium]